MTESINQQSVPRTAHPPVKITEGAGPPKFSADKIS